MSTPQHILLLDIDGLRRDVFQKELQAGRLPHLARALGRKPGHEPLQIPIAAPAPSITFCSQACLFTGAHPRDHGIPGNQFFDRFGDHNRPGEERHPDFYAFDVGDTLEVDDAVRVFADGYAAQRLHAPTFYERMRRHGRRSVVAGNMYATGATWLKPSLVKLARFIKGGNLFGMTAAEYDESILKKAIDHVRQNGMPDVLTVYFLGLDYDSHHRGPSIQAQSLRRIDGFVGRLWDAILPQANGSVFTAVFSDHGQIQVIEDDAHALKLGFPFDREMGVFFDALNLDVHDYPGEAPHCDAVLALNGGTAAVYLHNKVGHWWDKPDYERDVRPIARAFWEAHQTGKYAPDMKNSLAAVLIRNVEADGWNAEYRALTPDGEVVALKTWFDNQPDGLYLDPVNRLRFYTGRYAGDLMLISNYAEGYYFGKELQGMHGGLHPEDSAATLAYGWPGVSPDEWTAAQGKITAAIDRRREREGGRPPHVVDMLTGVGVVLGIDIPEIDDEAAV